MNVSVLRMYNVSGNVLVDAKDFDVYDKKVVTVTFVDKTKREGLIYRSYTHVSINLYNSVTFGGELLQGEVWWQTGKQLGYIYKVKLYQRIYKRAFASIYCEY